MPMQLFGSGTVSGLAVGGLPDKTVTQADLVDGGIAATGPAFAAAGSATSIPTTTHTIITYTNEVFDTASCFDPATGRFTPNVPGFYQFSGSLNFGGTAGLAGKLITLRKNGANGVQFGTASYSTSDSGQWQALSTSGTVFLNGSTDYVCLAGYIAAGGPATMADAYFSGAMVRADVSSAYVPPPPAAGGPAFSAYATVAQAIPAITFTKVNYATEVYDTAGAYDAAASRFTAPVPGYYRFTAATQVASSATGIGMYLRKNNVDTLSVFNGNENTGFVTGEMFLAFGDYVEAFVYFTVAQNNAASLSQTYFQGSYVRAA